MNSKQEAMKILTMAQDRHGMQHSTIPHGSDVRSIATKPPLSRQVWPVVQEFSRLVRSPNVAAEHVTLTDTEAHRPDHPTTRILVDMTHLVNGTSMTRTFAAFGFDRLLPVRQVWVSLCTLPECRDQYAQIGLFLAAAHSDCTLAVFDTEGNIQAMRSDTQELTAAPRALQDQLLWSVPALGPWLSRLAELK